MNAITKISPQAITKITPELQQEIEQFLYAEAEILDNRHFGEWYELLADDIHYYCAVKNKLILEDQREGFDAGCGGAIFDEDKHRMGIRVRKILSGRDHIERPASLLRRAVTNVRVEEIGEGKFRVLSYFDITRIRHDSQRDLYTGQREDIISRSNNALGWVIHDRNIELDQTLHLGGGIGFYF